MTYWNIDSLNIFLLRFVLLLEISSDEIYFLFSQNLDEKGESFSCFKKFDISFDKWPFKNFPQSECDILNNEQK